MGPCGKFGLLVGSVDNICPDAWAGKFSEVHRDGPRSSSEEGYHVASCLAWGSRGPEREDVWEAKVAFDEAFRLFPSG